MRMTNVMPTSGQFVAVWELTNGTVWSDAHIYQRGVLLTYDSNEDDWVNTVTFEAIDKDMIADLKFMIKDESDE